MRKYWKWIISAVCLVAVGLAIWFAVDYFTVPKWSQAAKERVKHNYIYTWSHWNPEKVKEGWEERWFEQNPIIWYDENGGVEEENVWRYIGTYGDCYAFLLHGRDVNYGFPEKDFPIPFPIAALSRTVYYPTVACVILYDTKGRLETNKSLFGEPCRVMPLYQVQDRNWLTPEQLEQLTQDIEKLAEEHE